MNSLCASLSVRGWFAVSLVAGVGHCEYLRGTETPKLLPTEINQTETALDKYVQADDDSYQWELIASRQQGGNQVSILRLVSQTWLSEDEVNRTVWQHWLTIVQPETAMTDTALLFITGGANVKDPPSSPSRQLLLVAQAAHTVVAELKMVPNQPLIFANDGEERVEDNIIGYSWDKFLKTEDPRWPVQLPMTKSAIRGMDAVQEFLASDQGGNVTINDFVVSGASKRGWTTWLTAATDQRVAAIAPIVIDVLNVNLSMQHHYNAYGFWAPAINDYVRHQITHRRFYPEYRKLLQIVDPFAYRDRLTMPKCIINASGDQFFLPDSSQFYFSELQGEKHLCYVPNADHSLRGSNAIETLAAFVYMVAHDQPRPKLDWTHSDQNTIKVRPQGNVEKVVLWQCDNADTRDFRVHTVGLAYQSSQLTTGENGAYVAHVETPAVGWRAYFVECTFDVGAATPIRFTTPVSVVPDRLPFIDKVAPVYEDSTENK